MSAVLRLANAKGFTVIPRGGRTDPLYADADVSLNLCRLNNVEHYDAGDLTVGVGAGMTVDQLNKLVGADRLMFAADPAHPELATIGGVLAGAKQGPLRHGYGTVRDFCIGIRFVTGDGRIAKGGGRVVKNVAGYDLMKLLIGSYGTLAVITSASFKLFPVPRQTSTFLAEFGTSNEALEFRDFVISSPLAPMCLEIVSPFARKLMRAEITDSAWVICVRASGSDAVVARFRKELGSAVTRELEGASEAGMWRQVENFSSTKMVFPDYLSAVMASVSVPISRVATLIQKIEVLQARENFDIALVGRAGTGSMVLRICSRIEDHGIHHERLDEFWQELERECGARAVFYGEPVAGLSELKVFDCMRAVKHALDPKKVLCGRYWP